MAQIKNNTWYLLWEGCSEAFISSLLYIFAVLSCFMKGLSGVFKRDSSIIHLSSLVKRKEYSAHVLEMYPTFENGVFP